MPKGSKVERCVNKVGKTRSKGSAIAICQASTGQSIITGKKAKTHKGKAVKRKQKNG